VNVAIICKVRNRPTLCEASLNLFDSADVTLEMRRPRAYNRVILQKRSVIWIDRHNIFALRSVCISNEVETFVLCQATQFMLVIVYSIYAGGNSLIAFSPEGALQEYLIHDICGALRVVSQRQLLWPSCKQCSDSIEFCAASIGLKSNRGLSVTRDINFATLNHLTFLWKSVSY